MNTSQIKKTWRRLIVPFSLGILIIIVGILWNTLGSGRSSTQAKSFFLSLFGVVLSVGVGTKMIKFKKYLKQNKL